MPTAKLWSFFSLIHKGGAGHLVQTESISECELNILWKLAREGPKSIYELEHTEYYLPELVGVLGPEISETREKITYHYPFVYKTVKRLEDRNLVQTSKDLEGLRMKRMAGLTFSGLMLYLQGSTDRRKNDVFEQYPELIPFSKHWHMLTRQLDRKRVIDAFHQTTKNCNRLTKAKFKIRPIQLEFQGFLRNIYTPRETSEEHTVRERDKETSELLSKEVLVLRNSYIAYLAVHDISKLTGKNKQEIEEFLPKLDSEKELAFWERKRIGVDPLFKGDRLREFFPKYADIKFFFTGMFVEKLLWHEKTIENKIYDFDVEYLFE